MIGTLTLVPLTVSIASGGHGMAARYAVVIACLATSGLLLSTRKAPADVQINEGMVLTALLFLFTPLVMSFPMMGTGMRFADAVFESVSGITTTGLSTLERVEGMPVSFLFSRAWMQWIGGLGIVIMSVALVVRPGLAARGLAVTESVDDLVGGTRTYARQVFLVYSLITVAGVILLWLMGADGFNSVVYTLASVSTGGFAAHDASLAGLGDRPLHLVMCLLFFSCSTPLIYYFKVYRKGWVRDVNLLQLKAVAGLILLFTLLVGLSMLLFDDIPWNIVFTHSFVTAASSQTTTGFSTVDVGHFGPVTKLLLIVSMAVGGGVGSTSGGIKVLRLMIILRVLEVTVARSFLATHAYYEPGMAGRKLQEKEVQDAMVILFLFVGVVFISWVFFVAHRFDPLDSLFEVVSAAGTVGLSTGITSKGLPNVLKGVLCADMLLGRLEILAWLILFHPRTWFGKRRF